MNTMPVNLAASFIKASWRGGLGRYPDLPYESAAECVFQGMESDSAFVEQDFLREANRNFYENSLKVRLWGDDTDFYKKIYFEGVGTNSGIPPHMELNCSIITLSAFIALNQTNIQGEKNHDRELSLLDFEDAIARAWKSRLVGVNSDLPWKSFAKVVLTALSKVGSEQVSFNGSSEQVLHEICKLTHDFARNKRLWGNGPQQEREIYSKEFDDLRGVESQHIRDGICLIVDAVLEELSTTVSIGAVIIDKSMAP